jgi:hypothetical protein
MRKRVQVRERLRVKEMRETLHKCRFCYLFGHQGMVCVSVPRCLGPRKAKAVVKIARDCCKSMVFQKRAKQLRVFQDNPKSPRPQKAARLLRSARAFVNITQISAHLCSCHGKDTCKFRASWAWVIVNKFSPLRAGKYH